MIYVDKDHVAELQLPRDPSKPYVELSEVEPSPIVAYATQIVGVWRSVTVSGVHNVKVMTCLTF
jgi:hypothetical protein